MNNRLFLTAAVSLKGGFDVTSSWLFGTPANDYVKDITILSRPYEKGRLLVSGNSYGGVSTSHIYTFFISDEGDLIGPGPGLKLPGVSEVHSLSTSPWSYWDNTNNEYSRNDVYASGLLFAAPTLSKVELAQSGSMQPAWKINTNATNASVPNGFSPDVEFLYEQRSSGIEPTIYTTGSSLTGTANYRPYITKYLENGTVRWRRDLSSAMDVIYQIEADQYTSSNQDRGEAIYISGTKKVNGSNDNELVLSKYTTDGYKIWTRSIEINGSISANATTIERFDGSIYVTGNTSSSLNQESISGASSGYITKYNSNGEVQWTSYLDDDIYTKPTDIKSTGQYIYTTGFVFGDFSNTKNARPYEKSIFISKHNRYGAHQFTQVFNIGTQEPVSIKENVSIEISGDDIYLAGSSRRDIGGNRNSGEHDMFLMKLLEYNAPNQTFLAERTYGYTFIDGWGAVTNIPEKSKIDDVVGVLATSDLNSDEAHTYTLVAGEGDANNNLFYISGNKIYLSSEVDPYSNSDKDDIYFRIRSTDPRGLFVETSFRAIVQNVNDTPINLLISGSSINENITAGYIVANLSSTDPDDGDTFTYSLVDGEGDTDNNAFTIVGDQLKIIHSPDFENKSSYSIRIRTTDLGGLSFEKAFTLVVKNIHEIPDNIINSSPGKGKLWGTRKADQFTFNQFEPFKKNTADKIIRFKPSQGDTIAISAAACPSLQGADEITFATARTAKEVKRLSRQDINFVYFQNRGRLFFNGNGATKGWGEPDEGGIFAFMHKRPELSADDFTLLA